MISISNTPPCKPALASSRLTSPDHSLTHPPPPSLPSTPHASASARASISISISILVSRLEPAAAVLGVRARATQPRPGIRPWRGQAPRRRAHRGDQADPGALGADLRSHRTVPVDGAGLLPRRVVDRAGHSDHLLVHGRQRLPRRLALWSLPRLVCLDLGLFLGHFFGMAHGVGPFAHWPP